MIERGDKLTRKERMLVAMRHGVPDRVPVCPDTSAMIPARLTGRPFWDVFLYKAHYIGDAYIQGSVSSLSLSSLRFYRKYNLPFIKQVTAR